jgi:hypothetical protein
MSFQIPENMVQQYGNNFRVLYQQKQSRLRSWCQIEAGIVGQSKSVERMGKAEAYDITSRHTDTKFVEVPHSRRWIDLYDKGWAELIDKLDKVRLLADPMNGYAMLANAALNRQIDTFILNAARGTARTNAGLSVLPSTQKIAVGGTSLTLAKLLTTKEILDSNEVDDDASMTMDGQSTNEAAYRVMVVNSKMLTNLYGTTELKSIDYNAVKALAQGAINTFLGFKFVRTELVAKDATATTGYACAWSRSCVALGIGQEISASVDKRPDKNNAWQVFADMSMGAVRIEDEGVVEIACA